MLCLVDAESDKGISLDNDDFDDFDDGFFVTTRSGRVAGNWVDVPFTLPTPENAGCMVHTKCSCVYGEDTKNLTWGMKFFY